MYINYWLFTLIVGILFIISLIISNNNNNDKYR